MDDHFFSSVGLHLHAGEAIIMLLVNYGDFSNVVTENIIKTRCSRIKRSMCSTCNQYFHYIDSGT